jgi:alpha-ribazole phosphatase/probable phosphoglycerate mutase
VTGPPRLILVRHAEPSEAVRGRCYGRLDIGLSPHGRRHARAIAERLADMDVGAIFTSPLRRARQTAAPIAAAHGLDPVVDDRLSEIDFGELEGLTYDEIERDRPGLFRRWAESPTETGFPGGEHFDDLKRRSLSAVAGIREGCGAATAVVVSHGGPIRMIVAHLLGLPDDEALGLDQPYGAITIVDWAGTTPTVRLVVTEADGSLASPEPGGRPARPS